MSTRAYYPTYPSTPINMPQKPGHYYPPPQHYGRIPGSPPEASDSSTTTSGVPSYEVSANSSHYAGSHSDYDSSSGAASVDLLDYMGNRLNGSFNPLPLDRSLAKQAQTLVLAILHISPKILTKKQIRRIERQTPRTIGTAGVSSAKTSWRASKLCVWNVSGEGSPERFAVDAEACGVSNPQTLNFSNSRLTGRQFSQRPRSTEISRAI